MNPLRRVPIINRLFKKFDLVEARLIELEEEQNSLKDELYSLKAALWNIQRDSYIHRAMLENGYEDAIKKWFLLKTGRKLDLRDPKTCSEKIQWIKLYDNSEKKTLLADKYQVKKYIEEKLGKDFLIPLLGVWETFDEINFEELPDKFILKTNHGSGMNVIVTNKQEMKYDEIRNKFYRWLATDYSDISFELHYKNIKPLIIAEEYIEGLNEKIDYRFWCFDGEPMYIQCRCSDRKSAFYNLRWERCNFWKEIYTLDEEVQCPERFADMLNAVRILCQGFILVRVDFYCLDDGNIKFGEMTFTPASGIPSKWTPFGDRVIGDQIHLPI